MPERTPARGQLGVIIFEEMSKCVATVEHIDLDRVLVRAWEKVEIFL